MVKIILLTLLSTPFVARAQSCKSLLKPELLRIANADFIYLTTLLQAHIYDPSNDRVDHSAFRLKKLGRENLIGVILNENDGRHVFIELLKHDYLNLSIEELRVGQSFFKSFVPTTDSEKLAKALITFYLGKVSGDFKTQANAALLVLGKTENPQLMWHQAEINFSLGNYKNAQALLQKILNIDSKAPEKVRRALKRTKAMIEKNLSDNELSMLRDNLTFFDDRNWGLYQESN